MIDGTLPQWREISGFAVVRAQTPDVGSIRNRLDTGRDSRHSGRDRTDASSRATLVPPAPQCGFVFG